MSTPNIGQANPRRDNRHHFIYLAQAIDLSEGQNDLADSLEYVAARASEFMGTSPW